jgi:putative quinone oxidoreductase, YhdH/YhfP family
VSHSTINYKDGLAFTGRMPVVRSYPMVPGIDGVGVITQSHDEGQNVGDHVIVNGWGLGETRWGCLAEKARVAAHMTIPLPNGITPLEAMTVGTAGYTAMLCVQRLLRHGLKPSDGPIAVTGASGGVGSFAIMFLSSLGFEAVAITGKLSESDYLISLGASDVRDRGDFGGKFKPMERETWSGAIDSVGSNTLAHLLAATKADGCVAACGNARGMDLTTTVFPFILRGITLAGVDSVMIDRARRLEAWAAIAEHLDRKKLNLIGSEIVTLEGAKDNAHEILEGSLRGALWSI